jgi:hypothetical protein
MSIMEAILYGLGLAVIVGSAGFFLSKPRQTRRPRISIQRD